MPTYQHVFSPLKIGRVEIKNRIAVSPMLPCLATPDGIATRELVEYYQGYARGGSAMVNLGDSCVDAVYGRSHFGELNMDTDKVLAGLSTIAEAIHKFGAKATIELNHPGRMTSAAKNDGRAPIAPSPIPTAAELMRAGAEGRAPGVITEMDQSLIDHAIGKFVGACERCLTAGFEMVMIHGGHGQLISQFASSYTNRRTDRYGGTLENRARFANELLSAIRSKVGDRLVIEYRISADEMVPEGMHLEETIEYIRLIQDKIDMVHLSVGMLSNPEAIPHMAQPAYFPRGYNVPRAEKVKKAVDIPVACVGSIVSVEMADRIIGEGKADVIAMGRAHVADPGMVNKTFHGKEEAVRPCVRCNLCGERIPYSMPIRCAVNPTMGREVEHRGLLPPEAKKKIVIIGGGPAGMQAAVTASSRGHGVVLFEKEETLGGALVMAASPGFKQDMKRYLEWLVSAAKRSDAEIRTAVAATPELVKAERPDVIIVAAGAEPIIPEIGGIRGRNVVWAGDVDTGTAATGESVVVVGAGMTGCETALHLAHQNKRVTLVDLLPEADFATGASGVSKVTLIEMLHRETVEFRPETRLSGIRDDQALFMDREGTEISVACDTVVISMGVRPRRALTGRLRGLAPEIYEIGDCKTPGNLKGAVHDAFNLAVEL